MPLISEDILLFICGVGILQGLLLAVLIFFHPRSDRSVNTFLALHIFFISVAMTMPFAVKLITWQRGNLMQPVLLLPAIFLFLYVRSFKERFSFQKLWPHFVIFFLFTAIVFWNTSSIVVRYPDVKAPPVQVFHEPVNIIIPVVQICLKIFYYFLAIRTLLAYQKSIQQLFSETSRINLVWAKALANCYLFLVLAGTIIFILMMSYPQYFNLLLLINVIMGTPYIYFATYKGMTQPTIWQLTEKADGEEVKEREKVVEKNELDKVQADKIKIMRPGLAEYKIDEIVNKLIELMKNERLYTEPELTLQQLADDLNYPAHQVSQAINEGLKKSFYDLVNGYRVEEAKRLLLDPKNKNYTVLSIGFEAGFNSKTTFNTVFKKFTGQTPTDYREKQQAASVIA